jgi:hypothetical protein
MCSLDQQLSDDLIQLGGEGSPLPLIVPLVSPSSGAQPFEVSLEVGAGLVFFSLDVLAPVEVNIVLPAVSGLVHVGEPGVKGNSLAGFRSSNFYGGHFNIHSQYLKLRPLDSSILT